MAELKVTFGETYLGSKVEVDGAEVKLTKVRLVSEGGSSSYLEFERPPRLIDGVRRIELVRRLLRDPVELTFEVPEDVAERLKGEG